MMCEEIELHPTYLSFVMVSDPARIMSDDDFPDDPPFPSIASCIKDGVVHVWVNNGSFPEDVTAVVATRLSELLPEEELDDNNSYGQIAAKTFRFVERLRNSGRL
jgi:hypothetical protein